MTVADARRDLDWLAHIWPDLHEARLRGTPRTYLVGRGKPERQVLPGLEMVTVMGAPAPLHLDVLDLLVELVAWADMTAESVSQVLGVAALDDASSAFADPRPFLRHVSNLVGPLWQDDPGYADDVAGEARTLAARVAHALGLIRGGMTLDCDCPYCGQPRVLTVVAREHDEPLIVCMGACWLDDDETGHASWRGRRAWAHPDGWSQLAKLLDPNGRALTLTEIARELSISYERVKKWQQRGFLQRLGQTPDGRLATYSLNDARLRLADQDAQVA